MAISIEIKLIEQSDNIVLLDFIFGCADHVHYASDILFYFKNKEFKLFIQLIVNNKIESEFYLISIVKQ